MESITLGDAKPDRPDGGPTGMGGGAVGLGLRARD